MADVPTYRRLEDVDCLVRRWVVEGAVDPRVAARFLHERGGDGVRRRTAWSVTDEPGRRTSDAEEA